MRIADKVGCASWLPQPTIPEPAPGLVLGGVRHHAAKGDNRSVKLCGTCPRCWEPYQGIQRLHRGGQWAVIRWPCSVVTFPSRTMRAAHLPPMALSPYTPRWWHPLAPLRHLQTAFQPRRAVVGRGTRHGRRPRVSIGLAVSWELNGQYNAGPSGTRLTETCRLSSIFFSRTNPLSYANKGVSFNSFPPTACASVGAW